MKAETFYEGDNPVSYTDEDHGVIALMEQERKVQEENESRNTVITDFEGLPLFVVSGNSLVDLEFYTEKNGVFFFILYDLLPYFSCMTRFDLFGRAINTVCYNY